MKPTHLAFVLAVFVALAPRAGAQPAEAPGTQRKAPDVPYVPTPPSVVNAMLDLAKVKKGDLVYDLGCGDGRIVIEAAKRGARGVGIDIDPDRIAEARRNAAEAGVSDRVQFRQQDLFDVDLRDADVVTLYLLQAVNMRLRPKLLEELRPGARVVSHAFDMGDWEPQDVAHVDGSTAYLWIIPKQVPANLKRTSWEDAQLPGD